MKWLVSVCFFFLQFCQCHMLKITQTDRNVSLCTNQNKTLWMSTEYSVSHKFSLFQQSNTIFSLRQFRSCCCQTNIPYQFPFFFNVFFLLSTIPHYNWCIFLFVKVDLSAVFIHPIHDHRMQTLNIEDFFFIHQCRNTQTPPIFLHFAMQPYANANRNMRKWRNLSINFWAISRAPKRSFHLKLGFKFIDRKILNRLNICRHYSDGMINDRDEIVFALFAFLLVWCLSVSFGSLSKNSMRTDKSL